MINSTLMKYCSWFSVLIALALPARLLSKDISVPDNKPCFIRNVGQVTDIDRRPRNDIDYKFAAKSLSIFVKSGKLQYQWYRRKTVQKASPSFPPDKVMPAKESAELYAMQVQLIGADEHAVAVEEKPQTYYENYYLPYCNGKIAHSYSKITYKDVYPNIDWVLYTNGDQGIKYDFIVRTGGKVADIRLQYTGASDITLNNGALSITTPMGVVKEEKPLSIDITTGKEIESKYLLNGNTVSFVTAQESNIIIDPVLNWGTYFVNPNDNSVTCTAADTLGNVYACGFTALLSNIATTNAYKSSYDGGPCDVFLAQLNTAGTTVNWATYYGGEDEEKAWSVATDANANIYVAGYTYSDTGIGVGNAQQRFNGSTIFANGSSPMDGFLARFNKSGAINWATYVGGHGGEVCYSVICDASNNVYVGGSTTGNDSLATSGTFQSTGGANTGFLAKYNAATGKRVWGTFFNGLVFTVAYANNNSIYIGGYTKHYAGVATTGAYQQLYYNGPGSSGFPINGFLVRFNTEDGTRKWGTYCGYYVQSLVCDSLYNVYSGAFDSSIQGSLYKFDSTGTFKWKKYYPATIYSMALSPDNKIYASGHTLSYTDITTPDALVVSRITTPPSRNIGLNVEDNFLSKFNRDGKLLYGTYYGGADGEAYGVVSYGASAGSGKVYMGGTTYCYTNISTPNGYQPDKIDTYAATGYLAQFQADTNVYIKFPYVDTLLCIGGPLALKYGVTNRFKTGNVFTVQLSDATGSFSSPANIGSLSYNDQYSINCTIPLGTPVGTNYRLRILSSAPADTFYNYDVPVRISEYPYPTAISAQPICANLNLTLLDTTAQPPDTKYNWLSPNPSGITGHSNPNIVTGITLADSGDYILVEDNHGCIGRDTVHVHVTVAPPNPTVTGDTSLCLGDTLRLLASSPVAGVTFAWFRPDNSFVGYVPNVEVQKVTFADAGKYRVSAELNGCQSDPLFGQIVTVHPLPQPIAGSNSPICEDDTLRLSGSDTTTVSYAWAGPQNFTAYRKDTIKAQTTVASGGVYTLKTTTIHGCSSMVSATVTVKPSPKIEALSNSPLCRKDDLKLSVGNGASAASYSWTGPANYTANTQNATIPGAELGQAGVYKVTANVDGCIREATTTVIIADAPDKPDAASNSPLFTGEVLKLNILNALSHISYNWAGPNGFISQLANPVVNNATPAMSGLYTVIARVGSCTAYDTITVVVTDAPGKNKGTNDILVFPNPNNGVFRVKGTTKENNIINLAIFASDGKRICETSIQPANNIVDQTINIGAVANGVYRLKIWIDGRMIPVSFTVKQ